MDRVYLLGRHARVPKSRRSAAIWRPTSRGGCWRRWTCSTSDGRGRSRPRSCARGPGPPDRPAVAPRKYLVWELSDDVYLLMHLRMTGTILIVPDPSRGSRACGSRSATTSWCSTTSGASGPASWRSGRRRWPRSSTRGSASSRFHATSPATTCTLLAQTPRAPVKAFLLDQKRVAGVGNIYADEALFRARVHPLRRPTGSRAPSARRCATRSSSR